MIPPETRFIGGEVDVARNLILIRPQETDMPGTYEIDPAAVHNAVFAVMIDLPSRAGEIVGRLNIVAMLMAAARIRKRRDRANRYRRISTRLREPFRFRNRASRGGTGKMNSKGVKK